MGGQPVSPVTVGEIENKVLSRARELREQSLASSSSGQRASCAQPSRRGK